MSIVAILPVASIAAANAALDLAGFGPGNFSVPAYGGTGATHAALHAWHDAAFETAAKAIAGVKWADSDGAGSSRRMARMEAVDERTQRRPVSDRR